MKIQGDRRKQVGSFLLTLVFFLVFSPMVKAEDFVDVDRTNPHYTAISYLSQQGVVSGYDDKSFRAENPINRAEVLKVIEKGSGILQDEPFGNHFSDVLENDWFAPYVMKAKALGFVQGNEGENKFMPERQVNLAEFLKMLLLANNLDVASYQGPAVSNIPADSWYVKYVGYAVGNGLVAVDANGSVDPARFLTRGDVVSIMYLLTLVQSGADNAFILSRAEAEMAQIEVYIAANMVTYAKNSSKLAVDLTQQAYKNDPTSNVVLGAAKISKAYDWLVDSFVFGIQGQNESAAQKANEAIDKATEAWEVNNATQPIAKHIKERAREILVQVGGTEN